MRRLLTLIALMALGTTAWAGGGACIPPFLTANFGVTASDVGMGQDGTLWSIGAGGVNLVVRGTAWTGGSGLGLPGGQPTSIGRIAAGPDGSPWAVDDNNHIWHYTTAQGWQGFPGLARDIGITADGTPWVIGTLSASGGFHIYFWNGGSWVQVSGAGVRITGGSGGDVEPWVTSSSNNIYHRNSNGSWTQFAGLGVDIAVDLLDTPWVLGNQSAQGGGQIIWHFISGTWQSDPNAPGGIAITGSGGGVSGAQGCGAYFVNSSGQVELIH